MNRLQQFYRLKKLVSLNRTYVYPVGVGDYQSVIYAVGKILRPVIGKENIYHWLTVKGLDVFVKHKVINGKMDQCHIKIKFTQ